MAQSRSLQIIAAILLLAAGYGLRAGTAESGDRARPDQRLEVLFFPIGDRGRVQTYEVRVDNRPLYTCSDRDRDGILDSWEILTPEYFTEYEMRDRNQDRRIDHWYMQTGSNSGLLALDDDYDGVAERLEEITIIDDHQSSKE
jgi:hypothetical protein